MNTRHLSHLARNASRTGRVVLLAAAAFLTVAAGPANGRERVRRVDSFRGYTLTGALVETRILVEGRRTALYAAPRSDERRYFEATRGDDYAIEIRNRTGRRVAVLIVVDGLNVVNGERSSLSRHEPMYVLDPWEHATIRGWRTSLEDVRQFVFVEEERSYASRSGQANGDMGWIRVLAFEERRPVAVYQDRRPWLLDERSRGEALPPPRSDADAPPATSEKAAPSPQKPEAQRDIAQSESERFPGTGWGRERRDPVRETWFDPAARPTDHLVLRYEYESGLVALGIFPDRDRLSEREHGERRFALPPIR